MSSSIELLYRYDPLGSKMPIPIYDIPSLYVSFDQITGRDLESVFFDDVKREKMGRFYSLIGGSGAGKSSILNYFSSELFDLKFGVFSVTIDEFVSDVNPKRVLTHFLKKINEMASQYNRLPEKEREKTRKLLAAEYSYTAGEKNSLIGSLRAWAHVIPAILGLESKVSGGLETYTETVIKQSADLDDLIVFANEMVEYIRSDEKVKHVIFFVDETDKITEPEKIMPSARLAELFFQKMIPILSKIDCSFMFVMNQQYDTPRFKRKILDNYFDRILKIPLISDRKGIETILDKRIKAVCDASVQDVFEEQGIEQLFKVCRDRSLRDFIWVSKISVEKAWREAADTINISHVRDAMLECFM